MFKYMWGYYGSDTQCVYVVKAHEGARDEDLFDVTLYDPDVIDANTGRNSEDQSLFDLRELIGYANAALKAELAPEPVADKE